MFHGVRHNLHCASVVKIRAAAPSFSRASAVSWFYCALIWIAAFMTVASRVSAAKFQIIKF